MRKALILLVLAAISLQLVAQHDKVSLKFSPFTLLDPVSFPTLTAGMEYQLSPHFSWYNELGIKTHKVRYDQTDTRVLPSRGFKLKTEIRYYIDEGVQVNFTGSYLGANFFLTRDQHNSNVGYFPQKNSFRLLLSDDFGVTKTVMGLNLVCGDQKSISKRLLLDVDAGLGLRVRSFSNPGQQYNPAIDRLYEPDVNFYFSGNRSRIEANRKTEVLTNITLGIRLCFAF